MRAWYVGTSFALIACGGDGSSPPGVEHDQVSACAVGVRIQGDALKKARSEAPPCERNADCVVMLEQASCEGRFELELCDLSVHREVLKLYDEEAVSEALCDALRDSELGCALQASCESHGDPICSEGECVFADAS
jgi:hypothetical protein